MTRILLSLGAILICLRMTSQIPLTITEFDFATTPLINIAVGDADANGKTDIYVIAEGAQKITRLTNLGNGTAFTSANYLALTKQPESVGVISLNGGDDLYYTLEGDKGMYTLYSKDPWNSEKKDGPVLLDTIGGITQAHLKTFNYPRLVMTSDTAGDLHFVEIINGSFNVIFAISSYSINTTITPGQMSSFVQVDTITYFVPDVLSGLLLRGSVIWNSAINQLFYQEPLEVIDTDLQHPMSSFTYTDAAGSKLLFVLDTGKNEIYKYVFQEESFEKTTIDAAFTSPSLMSFGYIDNDTLPDLVVADGSNLWLLSNAPSRSLQPELIMSYEEPIGEFYLADFNNDGIDDIVSVPVSRNKVLVSRNDILSGTQPVEFLPFGYWPNPAQHELYFNPGQKPAWVKFISADGRSYVPQIEDRAIVLNGIPSGIYTVQTGLDSSLFIDKVYIQN
ncbi:MAG: VCBS repeat-containing protein [Saprospiraceae bacterium]|nr:VCBS repeat-containing protein [Candidatus Opimibacter iunctus]